MPALSGQFAPATRTPAQRRPSGRAPADERKTGSPPGLDDDTGTIAALLRVLSAHPAALSAAELIRELTRWGMPETMRPSPH